jgi:hypothetical protein
MCSIKLAGITKTQQSARSRHLVFAGEAGSVWRADKLRDLDWRARTLGIDSDPAIAALAAQIREHTAALEALAEAQRQPGYERKWWQDGEYDSARADQ